MLRDEFNAIAARQPTSVAAIEGSYRLQHYALLEADKAHISETVTSRAKVSDIHRACTRLYDDAVLLGQHEGMLDGDRRKQILEGVVEGRCLQRQAYSFVRARALLDLAEMYLNAGNHSDAQTILTAHAKTHAQADKELADQVRAAQLQQRL